MLPFLILFFVDFYSTRSGLSYLKYQNRIRLFLALQSARDNCVLKINNDCVIKSYGLNKIVRNEVPQKEPYFGIFVPE